uniref:Ig-like domain-containing protein n=1 Tax=Astatotilapia calliptera TaxID=8154 RepID=A0A3P8PFE3_ASTCA
ELRADRTAVPVGGSVTLTCSVSPSSSSFGWKYYWYRDWKSYQPVTNGQISVSEGGLYKLSESVWIDTTGELTASIRPVVTLHPNWSEIYRGETITVRCEIHGGDTEWDYEWETNSIRKPPNQNEYRIISASSFNSENYRCKGRMKSSQRKTTEWSDSVTLTVSDSKGGYSCRGRKDYLLTEWSDIIRLTVSCKLITQQDILMLIYFTHFIQKYNKISTKVNKVLMEL